MIAAWVWAWLWWHSVCPGARPVIEGLVQR
jgi:hypothetical protein